MGRRVAGSIAIRLLIANVIAAICLVIIASRQLAGGRKGAASVSLALAIGLLVAAALKLLNDLWRDN